MCGAEVLLEACFSCKITERILPTSFDGVLPVLGLTIFEYIYIIMLYLWAKPAMLYTIRVRML
mgnify:CR=1 FL=1